MFTKIRGLIRTLTPMVVLPSTISLAYVVLGHLLGYEGGVLIGGMVAFFMFLGALGEVRGDGGRVALSLVLWVLVGGFLSLFFLEYNIPISISRTTLALASAIWVLRGIDFLYEKLTQYSQRKKEEATQQQLAEKQAFVDRVNALIGNEPQTKALLNAIERLTSYTPDMAASILGPLSRDAERYVMLRALEETTSNDILRTQSRQEAEEIVVAARTLCSSTTEMALELLSEYQAAEAEQQLGNGRRGSELAQAAADFQKYLDSLREVREYAGPRADEKLVQEIDDLQPSAEVKKLPAKASNSRRGSGNRN